MGPRCLLCNIVGPFLNQAAADVCTHSEGLKEEPKSNGKDLLILLFFQRLQGTTRFLAQMPKHREALFRLRGLKTATLSSDKNADIGTSVSTNFFGA